jgi:anti-sigma regulatory factor (Ser/Thr protein kinase)
MVVYDLISLYPSTHGGKPPRNTKQTTPDGQGFCRHPAGKKEPVKGTSSISFRADPAVFGDVRRYVAQFMMLCGGSDEDAADLELATGEVLVNAYRHAYRKAHGPLQLDLDFDGQKVEVRVHDEGDVVSGMLTIPSTLPGGSEHRGLYLVGKMTDQVEIVHPRTPLGGTTVRMVRHVNKLLRLTSILGLT